LLKNVRIFEVDQPASQAHKRRRIHETGIEVPPNLTYVPVDFRHDKLSDSLHAAGYDSSQITFFIWEGVTMYLTDAAMEETSRWIGAQAAGSVVVFDFVYRNVIDWLRNVSLDHLPEAARKAVERVSKMEAGEPWLFGIPNGKEAEFLKNFGLTVTELMPIGGEESRKRYLTRSDGTFYIPLPPGMERPPSGGASNASYCLAEARV
jgi:methyltransferase (TIGR00027 family)